MKRLFWVCALLLLAIPAQAQLGNLPNMTPIPVLDVADLMPVWDASGSAVRSVRGDTIRAFVLRGINTYALFDAIVADETIVNTDDAQTITNKTLDGDDNTVQDLSKGALKASTDFGDVSTDGSSNLGLDAGVVTAAKMADADHGDVSWSSGVATVEDLQCTDCIGPPEISDSYLLNNGDTATGTFDFGGATFEIPNSTSLPGTCSVGMQYMDTDATTGQRLYLCESTNTWALQGDGGGTEANDLEGQGPTSIEDTELYIGNGSGSGTFAAMSGNGSLSNAGVFTLDGSDNYAFSGRVAYTPQNLISDCSDGTCSMVVTSGITAYLDLADQDGGATALTLSSHDAEGVVGVIDVVNDAVDGLSDGDTFTINGTTIALYSGVSDTTEVYYSYRHGALKVRGAIQDTDIIYTALPVSMCVAISDETTDLTTGTAKATVRAPWDGAWTLTGVKVSVNTAPTGATLEVDINESASSVLSTILSIDATEETSVTAATPAVISDSAIASDAELTFDIDQIGSTVAGKGAKVCLIGTRSF